MLNKCNNNKNPLLKWKEFQHVNQEQLNLHKMIKMKRNMMIKNKVTVWIVKTNSKKYKNKIIKIIKILKRIRVKKINRIRISDKSRKMGVKIKRRRPGYVENCLKILHCLRNK